MRAKVTATIAELRALLRDPHLPWKQRVVLLATVAYLLNPIDLIPDFIPVLGYLDDVVIVALVLRWLARQRASDGELRTPTRT